jgi:hypothetical protein
VIDFVGQISTQSRQDIHSDVIAKKLFLASIAAVGQFFAQ